MRLPRRPLAALLAAGWIVAGCDSPTHTETRPDVAAPSVQLSSPVSGSTVTTATATIAGTAADSAGVARVTVQVNGGAEEAVAITAGTSVSFSATVALAMGPNTVALNAYDAAGNRGTSTLGLTRANPGPALVGFSIDPDSVDVRTGAATAQLTFRVSTAFLVTGVAALLQNASGNQLTCTRELPTSTDAQGVGTFVCPIDVGTGTSAGPYTVVSVTVSQASGSTTYTPAQLQQAGFETRLAVAAPPPAVAPVPLGLSFAPDPVNVSGASATVTFTVRATHPSGVKAAYVLLMSPQGGEVGRCLAQSSTAPVDATMQCSIVFANKSTLQPGTLRVWLGIYSAQGGYQLYTDDALAARGFDASLQVEVDTTPPALVGLDLTPDSVDVRTADASAFAIFRVSHGYRADRVSITLADQEGGTHSCEAFSGVTDASGVQVFSCAIALQPTSPSGSYTVTQVVVSTRNAAGAPTTITYNTAALAAGGSDTTLKVVGSGDRAAPTVIGLSFGPDPLRVTGAQATVTFDVRLSDPGSGTSFTYVFLIRNGGEAARCSSQTLVSGTPADGTFRCSITFVNSPSLQPATYGVSVSPHDRFGNFAIYTPAQLEAAGFDATFEVQVNTSTPRLLGVSIVPDSVDVTDALRPAGVFLRVTNGYRALPGSVTLSGPESQSFVCSDLHVESTDASGAQIISCPFGIPSTASPGTYTVTSVRLDSITYTAADLTGPGFATQLKVVNRNVTDHTAPAVAALTVSPDTVHLSGGDQPVTFSARVTDAVRGATRALFLLSKPDGSEYSRCTTTTLVSGTRNDGVFSCSLVVVGSFAATPTGTYRVGVGLTDAAGNYRFYSAASLAAQGFDTTLEVQP